jgi:hypothetical protein
VRGQSVGTCNDNDNNIMTVYRAAGRYVPNWTWTVYRALSRYATARRLPTPIGITINAAVNRHTTGCARLPPPRGALARCIGIAAVVYGDPPTGWSPAAARGTATPIGHGRANGRALPGPRGRSIPRMGVSDRHRRRRRRR